MSKILAAFLLLASFQVNAAQHIDLGVGFNFPMGVENISDNADTGLAASLGWRNDASEFLSFGLGYYYLDFNNSTLSDRALYAQARYTLRNQDLVVTPYLNAGVGVSNTRSRSSSESLSTILLGGGFENSINEKLSLNVTVNYHLISPENTNPSEQHLLVALVGLSYRFGDMFSSRPESKQEIVQFFDEDGDGVEDRSDQCAGTPIGTEVNYLGCNKNKEIKKAFDIKFELGTAKLQSQYSYDLEKIAELLIKHPTLTIEVHGHTDNSGKRDFNLTLSQQRAESVAEYLIIQHNISADRVFARGYGPDRPLTKNDTIEGRKLNRRVEVKFITE